MSTALAGRYRVEREIGRGASSVVYLAYDMQDEREVAIKVLHADLAEALGGQRFLREIRTAAAMEHPNLVPIYDSGQVGDLLYYTSPYMAEGSLRARLLRERQLSVEDTITVARDIAAALAHVHGRRILHRDIKPENILFAEGRACLADFGIARAADSASGETITSTGIVVGTPTYMSPEQASGDGAVDARSDQYGLACVVYEMLAGVPPFIGASAQAVIAQRFAHPALPLTHYRPTVPSHVQAAVAQALSLTPADRFASVEAFVTALSDRPAAAAPASPPAGLRESAARAIRRRWFAFGAATAFVALAALGFTEAYPRVQAALSPALDTNRIAIVPFAGAGQSISGDDVADGLYVAFSEWQGLQLAEHASVRNALADGTRIPSLDEAFSVASAVRAGRLVWGRVSPSPAGGVVRAQMYDVKERRALREVTTTLAPGAEAAAAFASLADVLLRTPGLEHGPEGELGTRSFAARRAYERGELAYARGSFEEAGRSYAEAAEADPQFARAHLGVALAALLSDDDAASWRESARRAATADALTPRLRRLAAGLAALAEARYPQACAELVRAHPRDSSDFAVWYALGECRLHDSLVVQADRSPSGWAFRSSFHAAARAYTHTLESDVRGYSSPAYGRLRQVLKTDRNQLRRGFNTSGAVFAAFPTLASDTLAFIPHEISGAVPAAARPQPALHQRVLERNAELLLATTRTWLARQPDSPDALLAYADARELQGEVDPAAPGELTALEAVRRVRAQTTDANETADLQLREARLLVRAGEFAAASALADTLLPPPRLSDPALAPRLQALAAMTGRLNAAARLSDSRRTSRTTGALPAPLVASLARLETRAAAGACADVEPARAEVISAIEAYIAPDHWNAVRDELLALPGMWAAECTGGQSVLWSSRAGSSMGQLLRSFATGDRASATRLLDSLQADARHLRPGDVSLDFSYTQAWLRLAMGDTAGAAVQLDRILLSLPTHRATLFSRMPEAAALPRAMALRAEIAWAAGDRELAARWASVAATLWRSADREMRGSAARMRTLAAR